MYGSRWKRRILSLISRSMTRRCSAGVESYSSRRWMNSSTTLIVEKFHEHLRHHLHLRLVLLLHGYLLRRVSEAFSPKSVHLDNFPVQCLALFTTLIGLVCLFLRFRWFCFGCLGKYHVNSRKQIKHTCGLLNRLTSEFKTGDAPLVWDVDEMGILTRHDKVVDDQRVQCRLRDELEGRF